MRPYSAGLADAHTFPHLCILAPPQHRGVTDAVKMELDFLRAFGVCEIGYL
jgi:hypothetical protein